MLRFADFVDIFAKCRKTIVEHFQFLFRYAFGKFFCKRTLKFMPLCDNIRRFSVQTRQVFLLSPDTSCRSISPSETSLSICTETIPDFSPRHLQMSFAVFCSELFAINIRISTAIGGSPLDLQIGCKVLMQFNLNRSKLLFFP